MNFRKNAGYIITDSIHVGEIEFVLGVHSEAPFQFVTWACKDGKDYYWGHNHSDLMSATKDLIASRKRTRYPPGFIQENQTAKSAKKCGNSLQAGLIVWNSAMSEQITIHHGRA